MKLQVAYHPHGYPQLGLVAKSLPVRYRANANAKVLATRIERWEHERGNEGFRALNLHKLPLELAFELAHVYVALRERYPNVKPDFVNFSTKTGEAKTLGLSTIYPSLFPNLRQAAEMYEDGAASGLVDAVLSDEYFTNTRLELKRESVYIDETIGNVKSSGNIELGDIFTTKKHYLELLKFWKLRNERALSLGRPFRTPQLATSAASFVFIHEFGHLVDGEICDKGWKGAEKVYRALSGAILGVRNPKVSQWRYHLINYPCLVAADTACGPNQGGLTRSVATRKTLQHIIGDVLGSYAPTARDEIFAEAFALSHCGHRSLRQRLSVLPKALEQHGIRRRIVRG